MTNRWITQDLARQAVYALLDVLDGVQRHDIRSQTGLPHERCDEIANVRALCFDLVGEEWRSR